MRTRKAVVLMGVLVLALWAINMPSSANAEAEANEWEQPETNVTAHPDIEGLSCSVNVAVEDTGDADSVILDAGHMETNNKTPMVNGGYGAIVHPPAKVVVWETRGDWRRTLSEHYVTDECDLLTRDEYQDYMAEKYDSDGGSA